MTDNIFIKTLAITALSLFALSANAEIVETGNCNSAKTCKYELDGDGNLRIYGSGEISTGRFQSNLNIKSVAIEKGLTGICESCFRGLNNLKSVSIPNTVTSIGKEAFAYSWGLKSIVIPKSVTSIGYAAFGYTDATDFTIQGKDVSMADAFGYAFYRGKVNFTVIEGSETEKRLKELYGSQNPAFHAYIPPKRTHYTIEEAMEHIEKGDHNKITFTFK